MMSWIVDKGILYTLYAIFIASGMYISYQLINATIRNKLYSWNYRFRKMQVDSPAHLGILNKSNFTKHLDKLIKTTSSKDFNGQETFRFMLITSVCFLSGATIAAATIKDLFVSFVIGLLMSSIPYLILRIKLQNMRYEMTKEFSIVLKTIIQNYSSHHNNIYAALLETNKHIENKQLKIILSRLISELQISSSVDDVEESVMQFIYASGTSHAKRLGTLIVKAYIYQENISVSLQSMDSQIEKFEQMIEEEKTGTMPVIFSGFSTTPIFIGSIILLYFTIRPRDWISLQFKTQLSVSFFVICIVLIIFANIFAAILRKPKNDY
ncbi:hypothetical protein [Bacillus altitudinis]|uniref:hypothetical protein n=1 Tax=Bacillus altitudinis TaxID=293387 RepID=UPI00227FCF91|nr:hypothetical protein [Bacillus altitudinis]MCY7454242.1 hypothetical protein [Bacillus altitudinis]